MVKNDLFILWINTRLVFVEKKIDFILIGFSWKIPKCNLYIIINIDSISVKIKDVVVFLIVNFDVLG